jgi:hypothetical protein
VSGPFRDAEIRAERVANYVANEKWLHVLAGAHAVGWWPGERVWAEMTTKRAAVTDAALRNRLARLAKAAKELRGGHEPDDPRRLASEELTALLADLHRHGYSLRGLDAATGSRQGTTRRRLLRHGYWPNGDSPGYDRVDRYQGSSPTVSAST